MLDLVSERGARCSGAPAGREGGSRSHIGLSPDRREEAACLTSIPRASWMLRAQVRVSSVHRKDPFGRARSLPAPKALGK